MQSFKKINCLLFFILCFSDLSAQDWPNLDRYKIDNETIGLPKKGGQRIVFLGSSIIEFWKNVTPAFFKESYINRGIGGQTSGQLLFRFKADAVNLKPAVVIILAGSNDIAGNNGPATLEMICDNISIIQKMESIQMRLATT